MRCSHCGAALGPDAAWCGQCLAAVPPPGGYAAPPGAYAVPPDAAYLTPEQYAAAQPYGYATAPPPAWATAPAPSGPPVAAMPYAAAPGYPVAAPYAAPPGYPAPYAAPPGYPATPPYAAPGAAPYVPAPPGYPGAAPAGYGPVPGGYAQPRRFQPTDQPPHRAGWTTVAAIAVGALLQGILLLVLKDSNAEVEAVVRYSIVTVLAVYAVVTYLVVSRIQTNGHPLRWVGTWGVVPSAAMGFGIGGTMAWLLLQASKSAGMEGGDPWMALLVSEGDFAHIAAAFLIVCVAAPVVEELLFRGLLLASLAHRGTRVALGVSSFAFAAWHLDPSQLRYYSMAGALLGFLYLRKGLACSIAAHAAFNGTLLLAAVAFATAPGPVVRTDELTLRAPRGWHAVEGAPFGYLTGPSAAQLAVVGVGDTYADHDASELVARIQLGTLPYLVEYDVRTDTARTVELPVGEVVRVAVSDEGRAGELVLVPGGDDLYLIELVTGGSARVTEDFERMLETLTLSE